MAVLALCLAISMALSILERRLQWLPFAGAAYAVLASSLMLATGDAERALILGLIVTLAVIGFSQIKQHHSGLKLRAADLALMFAGTLRFLAAQYRLATAVTVAGGFVLVLAAGLVLALAKGETISVEVRWVMLVGATLVTIGLWIVAGGEAAFRRIETEHHSYFATFVASLIDVSSWWPSRQLAMVDMDHGRRCRFCPRSLRVTNSRQIF